MTKIKDYLLLNCLKNGKDIHVLQWNKKPIVVFDDVPLYSSHFELLIMFRMNLFPREKSDDIARLDVEISNFWNLIEYSPKIEKNSNLVNEISLKFGYWLGRNRSNIDYYYDTPMNYALRQYQEKLKNPVVLDDE